MRAFAGAGCERTVRDAPDVWNTPGASRLVRAGQGPFTMVRHQGLEPRTR